MQALLNMSDGIDMEVVVAEDGTTDAVALASNKWIARMPRCRYLPLRDNHGRAGIRNLLAREAKGERLLFLDDDVMPVSPDFLTAYLRSVSPVVCGGVVAAKAPHPDNMRWRWEKAWGDKHDAACRNRNPYANFTTANFMVRRDVMLTHPFDESIRQYGYEDVLFGISLREDGVEVRHIDAPVHHNGIDSNIDFLRKSEQALATLSTLPQIHAHAAVARMASRTRLLSPVLRLLCPVLRRMLLTRHPRLLLFQLYKLCYFHSLMR